MDSGINNDDQNETGAARPVRLVWRRRAACDQMMIWWKPYGNSRSIRLLSQPKPCAEDSVVQVQAVMMQILPMEK